MHTSLDHTTDTDMNTAELHAARNQQDPLKIAQNLNAIIQNMMHGGD